MRPRQSIASLALITAGILFRPANAQDAPPATPAQQTQVQPQTVPAAGKSRARAEL